MLSQYLPNLKKLFKSEPASGGVQEVSKFEDRVEEFGNSHWADLKTAYIVYHQQVWDCLLKYSGVLWIQWNNATKTYDIVDNSDEWTPTPEVNRFSPAIDSMMSNFQAVPEVEAVPNDVRADQESFAIADISTKLGRHITKTCALHADFKGDEDKPGRAGSLLTLAGSVFVRVMPTQKQVGERPIQAPVPAIGVKCPQCDTYQALPQDQVADVQALGVCPQCGGPTEVSQTQVAQPTGEVQPVIAHGLQVTVGNPLFALPRPGAKHMQDLGYMLWAERRSIDWVYEQFQYEAEPDQLYLDGYSTSYENTLQYFYTGAASSTVRTKEECLVVEMFIEPGKVKAIPEGCYAVMVNGNWIVKRPWDYVEHPITKCNYKNQPMLFFGRTDAFDLAKLQKESNHYESLIKLHAMTCASEPLVVDMNTVVEGAEATGRGDKVIKWRGLGPGSKEPHRLAHGTLDNGVFTQRDKLASEFQNVSGAVNVWRGEAPGSITAASAIAQLRGQAEQMFSTPSGNWAALWTEVVRKGVKILQATMDPLEIAAIVGQGKDVEIALFKKADLDTMLSFVSTKHGLPRTRDERRMEMLELWDRGMLDPSDINVKSTLVELFGETGMMQQFNKDATRARLENEQIKAGLLAQPAVLVGIEDLAVHAEVHKEQVKALDFDKWDPAAKQILIDHTLKTVEALQVQMEAQVQAAQSGDAPPTPEQAADDSGNAGPGSSAKGGGGAGDNKGAGRPDQSRKGRSAPPAKSQSRSHVGAANSARPRIPTGPNGPGAASIPGGNR